MRANFVRQNLLQNGKINFAIDIDGWQASDWNSQVNCGWENIVQREWIIITHTQIGKCDKNAKGCGELQFDGQFQTQIFYGIVSRIH